jgi:putative transposase
MKLAEIYPLQVVCQVLAYPRSSYYYQAHGCDDEELCEAIQRVAAEWPTYGYRRITAQLRRDKVVANSKRVRRLLRLMGLSGRRRVRKRRTTNSHHAFPRYPNLVEDVEVDYPNHVWVADITYVKLAHGFVYLAVVMDVFTRCIRGWYLSSSLDQDLTLTALRRALARATPTIHHSDQGVQYAARAYVELLQAAGVRISMAEVGEPTQNGYAERLMRTIKEEEVDLSEYHDYHDAYRQIGRFLDDVYMHKRIHSALGYLTPAEFEHQWRAVGQGGI